MSHENLGVLRVSERPTPAHNDIGRLQLMGPAVRTK